ncbi:sporulation histidine kinase inhibitor Sda [Chryseomicrobium sp. FSL W7-1435]|uniref:sporulation histidine kinase inhibitor Sda n=1 Tax=Chryseomicrobium sp. FSL W7-1435 TaxID=2921704 RepID=UPI003159CBB5
MRQDWPLHNRQLVRAYLDAKQKQLDATFLFLLKQEIKKRQIRLKVVRKKKS